jgi:hypothetical protein
MDPLLLVVLKVVGGAAGFALFAYLFYRGVLFAKRPGRAGIGGQLMGNVLVLLTGGCYVLDPVREVAAELRKLKRNQDGNGDPGSDSQP